MYFQFFLFYFFFVQSFTIIDRHLLVPEKIAHERFFERVDIEINKSKGVKISEIDMVKILFINKFYNIYIYTRYR